MFDSHADLCLIPPESIPFKPESESELSTVYYFTPESESESIPLIQSRESESIPPMNERFRPPMFQSGLFAPKRSAPDVIFTATGAILQLYLLPEATFIHIFDFFLGVEVSWTPPYGIKTELIPEPKVRSRNQYFLVNRNRSRNRFRVAMLCWKRNRNQPQFFSGIGIDFSQLVSSTSLSHTIRKMRNDYHLFKYCADLISVSPFISCKLLFVLCVCL